MCDTESWYKTIPKIRNVKFIFPNFQKQKKIEKIQIDSKKSINSFKKKKKGHLNIYGAIIFPWQFVDNFSALFGYYAKYIFLTSSICLFFLDFCYIPKYWNSHRIKLINELCVGCSKINFWLLLTNYMLGNDFCGYYWKISCSIW